MKLKKSIIAVIAGSLFISTAAIAFAQAASYIPKPVYNDQGDIVGTTRNVTTAATDQKQPADILETKEADVTGDGTADKVYLTGSQEAGSPYIKNIRIIVRDGVTNSIKTAGIETFAGYDPQLFLGDFNGDKIADVYVEAASGGSGGWYHHQIVTFTGDQPQVLFDDENNCGAAITGKFLNDYKVELKANGKTVILDVNDRQAAYLRLGLYDEAGLLKKETQTMITPYGKLAPVDVDNDGVYELQGLQRISGAYNADGLATVESVLKYNAAAAWQPLSVRLNITLM